MPDLAQLASSAAVLLILASTLGAVEPVDDHPSPLEQTMIKSPGLSQQAKWIAWYTVIEAIRKATTERDLDRLNDRALDHSAAVAALFPERSDVGKILDAVLDSEANVIWHRLDAHRGKPGAEAAWYSVVMTSEKVQAYDALVGLLAAFGADPWVAAVGAPRLESLRKQLASQRAQAAAHPAGKREQLLLDRADQLLAPKR